MFFSRFFHRKTAGDTNLRNFIFGVEDSLVSTVGLLSGVAAASVSRSAIITTGIVLIVVEGFSMGIGSFLTEETTCEMNGQKQQTKIALRGALIMLVSYCLAGMVPLIPYAILPGELAVTISIFASLLGLLILGFGTSLYYHRPKPYLQAVKMLLLGGSAAVIGILVGKLFHL
jgi:VIT1/CCC1 family predicted Fe2+/Mn2+ transporter